MIGYSVTALKSLLKDDLSSKQIANQVRFIVLSYDDNNDKQSDYLTVNCPRERTRQRDMRWLCNGGGSLPSRRQSRAKSNGGNWGREWTGRDGSRRVTVRWLIGLRCQSILIFTLQLNYVHVEEYLKSLRTTTVPARLFLLFVFLSTSTAIGGKRREKDKTFFFFFFVQWLKLPSRLLFDSFFYYTVPPSLSPPFFFLFFLPLPNDVYIILCDGNGPCRLWHSLASFFSTRSIFVLASSKSNLGTIPGVSKKTTNTLWLVVFFFVLFCSTLLPLGLLRSSEQQSRLMLMPPQLPTRLSFLFSLFSFLFFFVLFKKTCCFFYFIGCTLAMASMQHVYISLSLSFVCLPACMSDQCDTHTRWPVSFLSLFFLSPTSPKATLCMYVGATRSSHELDMARCDGGDWSGGWWKRLK